MNVNTTIPTGIHTRVDGKHRISSIYRNWGISEYPHHCGWETIVWEKDGESERIIMSESTSGGADNVVNRHAELYTAIKSKELFTNE